MTTRASRIRRLAAATAILGLAAVSIGCFNPFSPRIGVERGVSIPPPVPSTPAGVLRLLAWCYNNRNAVIYQELFTEDYRFVFNAQDSSGNQYTDATPWTRKDEINSATNLFEGGSESQSPASSIFLQFDNRFLVYPDTRRGKNGIWHKIITTTVLLNIRTADGNATDITGAAIFYLARGDSARIPQELKDRGFDRDSSRWYIERWEDETVQPALSGLAESGERAARPSAADDWLARTRPDAVGAQARHLPLAGRASIKTTAPVPTSGAKKPRVRGSLVEYMTATWGRVKVHYHSP